MRILSPYRLRATRVDHLFVAGLADGTFPAAGGADPLLSDERRRALGLQSRSDPAAEERYLFYACVSKPEVCLHLSYPASDEAGGTAPRSAFVDEVRDLLSPAATPDPADDPLEAELIERATLADFVPAPEDASAPHDLARALAAPGVDAASQGRLADAPRRRRRACTGGRRGRALQGFRRPQTGAPQPPGRAGDAGRSRPVRSLDPGGVPPLLLPLVRQPRAEAAPDRAGPGAARERRHRARDPRASLSRTPRRRGPTHAREREQLEPAVLARSSARWPRNAAGT